MDLTPIRKRITPTNVKLRYAQTFINTLNKRLQEKNILARAMLGGSTAKGTYLKGDHDVDIFVRFKDIYDNISDLLASIIPEATRVHGSRDYFHLKKHSLLFEIVPVLAITKASQAKNTTDASPLHVDYILKHIKRNPKLADDIRLAKQFCKAAKVYGAESYINGFSGHVLDILIIYYGSFQRLLEKASTWPDHVVLDPEKHHKNPRFTIQEAKQLGPLLLIDPIQPERNAAAALSKEKFDRFREAATAFLEKPAKKFFEVTPLTATRIKNEHARLKEGYLFIITYTPLEGKPDTVATKALKVHEYFLRQLKEFTILDNGFEFSNGNAVGYILTKEARLPAEQAVIGPPLTEKSDAKRFKAKHKNAEEKNGKLHATIKRKLRTPRQVITAAIKTDFVKKRTEKVTLERK